MMLIDSSEFTIAVQLNCQIVKMPSEYLYTQPQTKDPLTFNKRSISLR